MAARLPDPSRSRAVLIGCARYRNLVDLAAVTANLTAVRNLLTDPGLGGFSPGSCTVLDDPEEPRPVRAVLRDHARDTHDTFLVYYAGHGLLGARTDLHLALTGTDTDDLAYTALAYDQVRDVLLDCPASNRVVILDCCFAGAALTAMADPTGAITGQTVIEGSYVLAAPPGHPDRSGPARSHLHRLHRRATRTPNHRHPRRPGTVHPGRPIPQVAGHPNRTRPTPTTPTGHQHRHRPSPDPQPRPPTDHSACHLTDRHRDAPSPNSDRHGHHRPGNNPTSPRTVHQALAPAYPRRKPPAAAATSHARPA